ncbi:hypothetical protein [Limnothrix sp. PR1529]|uniref:hypothetical protein n=1 Tax=Limnothrix sp. PR1529 TaxID=1704291 RepID=UPI0013045036|nr:hypothetical protein [Limnothrix sp. PR1529]
MAIGKGAEMFGKAGIVGFVKFDGGAIATQGRVSPGREQMERIGGVFAEGANA